MENGERSAEGAPEVQGILVDVPAGAFELIKYLDELDEIPEEGIMDQLLLELADRLDGVAALTDEEIIREGKTYAEVTIMVEGSDIRGKKLSYKTKLTNKLELNLPLLSAAMDTVTEHEMAIALARQGGAGVIHKNLAPEEQAAEIERVKRASSALIEEPRTLGPEATVADFEKIKRESNIGSVMVVDDEGTLLGMVTKRELRPLVIEQLLQREDDTEPLKIAPDTPLKEIMYTFSEEEMLPVGASQEDAMRAFAELNKRSTDRLPVVDADGKLAGLYTIKDIIELAQYPHAAKDGKGRLLVGAAVGVGDDAEERLKLLVEQEVDFVVIDASHGYDEAVLRLVRRAKELYPDLQVIAGNAATARGTRALIEAGVDAVKVGIGGGASCTTRPVTGVGTPQLSAIKLASLAARGEVPIIADGGIDEFGDIGKALVAGADSVMIGGKFAGHDESPGKIIEVDGQLRKEFRGMGSEDAIKAGKGGRYFTENEDDIVPEGMPGTVPYRRDLRTTVKQMRGSITKAMFYTGRTKVTDLRNGRFVRQPQGAQKESHPHGMTISKEARNYTAKS